MDKRFNLYVNTVGGGSERVTDLNMDSVLFYTKLFLEGGNEITSIIDVEHE